MFVLLAFDSYTERDKFEYLYRKYKDLLFYKAWDILHDQMLAEDAVSEAYIRVFNNLHKIEDINSPRSAAFLVTIARNCALTILKKNKAELVEESPDEPIDPQNVEETVFGAFAAQDIYKLLDQLDEQSKNIFILKYAYDLPHGEIAAQLALTENNVTVKLHRAKKKLGELLQGRS